MRFALEKCVHARVRRTVVVCFLNDIANHKGPWSQQTWDTEKGAYLRQWTEVFLLLSRSSKDWVIILGGPLHLWARAWKATEREQKLAMFTKMTHEIISLRAG